MRTSAERVLRDGRTAVLRAVPYEDPVATGLVARVQQEYVLRYGGPDGAVVDPAEFRPPAGSFLVAEVDGVPAGCGAWRGGRPGGGGGGRGGGGAPLPPAGGGPAAGRVVPSRRGGRRPGRLRGVAGARAGGRRGEAGVRGAPLPPAGAGPAGRPGAGGRRRRGRAPGRGAEHRGPAAGGPRPVRRARLPPGG